MAHLMDYDPAEDSALWAPSASTVMTAFAQTMRGISRKYNGRAMNYETAAAVHDELEFAVAQIGSLEHLVSVVSHELISELQDLVAVEGVLDDGAQVYVMQAIRLAGETADGVQAYLRRCGLHEEALSVDVAEIAPPSPTVTIPAGTGLMSSDGTTFVTTNYTVTFNQDGSASTTVGWDESDNASQRIGASILKEMQKGLKERAPTLSEVWRD